MQKHLTQSRIYDLRGWSVKTEDGKFFVSPTAHFEDKPKWNGPYKSLQHAANAIVRKLQEEFTTRDNRLHPQKKSSKR